MRLASWLKIGGLIFTTLTLSACGGGGSDSGSGGGSGPNADFSGTYNGFMSLRRTGPRLTPVTRDIGIGFTVNSAGRIVLAGSPNLSAQINGNTFEMVNNIDPAERIFGGNLLCRGPEKITGTVTGNLITGIFEAQFQCVLSTGSSGQTNVLFRGPIRATRNSTTARTN